MHLPRDTGHYPFPTEKYLAHFAQAQQWCSENQLPITLHTGCEILYTDASPHLLKEGHYPSLAETWTVLVEFSGDVPYSRMCEAARLFGNAGFTVIFAHVERFDPMRNFKHVRELREEYGVYMQMNANTVLMKKGFFADRWTRKMLDEGYIDCIATDAHNTTSRPCRMRECFEAESVLWRGGGGRTLRRLPKKAAEPVKSQNKTASSPVTLGLEAIFALSFFGQHRRTAHGLVQPQLDILPHQAVRRHHLRRIHPSGGTRRQHRSQPVHLRR